MSSRFRIYSSALLLMASLSGCYAVRRVPVTEMPIRLASPSRFVLHSSNAMFPDSARSCTATRAEGTVHDMRGDTLFLTEARILTHPRHFARCQLSGPVHVVLSDYRDLRAESFSFSTGRSVALGIGAGIGAVSLFVVLAIVYALASSGY